MLGILLSLVGNVYAVPTQVTQQGRILDTNGTPVEGAHIVFFRLYDAETNGNLLWDDVLTVQFSSGYYASILGADINANPLDSSTLSSYPLFLELQLDSNAPMSPRQLITSAPYSQISGVAESVDGGKVNASDIDIGNVPVIDSNRNWVGEPISVDWSQIQNIPTSISDGDDNTQLSEQDVENFVTNDALSLHPDTTLNGQEILTIGMDSDTLADLSCSSGDVAKYDSILGWYCDLDSDTQLSSSEVVNYVESTSLNLSAGSKVDGQNILTQPSSCSDGQILVYSMSTGSWACGNDSDTTLTASEVQAMVESVAGLALQAGATVDGSPILTEASSINPSQIDTTGSVAGQILTSDGNVLNWTDGGGNGCTVEESFRTYPVKIRLKCGSDTYIVNGSTLVASAFSQFGPWVGNHYCAISNTGEVFCWGQDDDRQVSDSPSGSFTSLASGSHFNCGIQTDESVFCWGRDTNGQVNDAPNGSFTNLSLGETHACGIQSNGSIVCWGYDGQGQVSNAPSGSFTNLSSGENHICGIQTDGSVVCWGYDDYGQVSNAPSGSFTSLSSGKHFTCGIQSNGGVLCWGLDNYDQVGGAPNGNFTKIQAAHQHICGIQSDESLVCWGRDDYGQVSDTPSGNFTATSGGDYHTCGIRTDGSVTCWGYQYSITGTPPTGNFSAIQSNEQSNCGILDSGNVICWGNSSYNQTSPP